MHGMTFVIIRQTRGFSFYITVVSVSTYQQTIRDELMLSIFQIERALFYYDTHRQTMHCWFNSSKFTCADSAMLLIV